MRKRMAMVATVAVVALAGCSSGSETTPPTSVPSSPATTAATEEPVAGLEPLWPQSSLEEVRQAQERADVGDPRYTWQVDPALEIQIGQHHPNKSRTIEFDIFARFLEEKLGWEKFQWEEAFAHPDGLDPGDVVYVRCAPGPANPLYPTDPESPACAPTIDEFRYETVKINVAQLGQQGPSGIWVVTGWEMLEPAEQNAPPSDAEIDAVLAAFLRARIEGKGAEEFDIAVNDPFAFDPSDTDRVPHEIPLLYATSTGVPYERSEIELVDGPVWPSGWEQFEVRLFAEKGKTVVKQVFSMERDETGRLGLGFDPMGLEGSGPTTTENGKAVPLEYGFQGGEVTYRAAYPAGPGMEDSWDRGPDWVTIVGTCGRNEAGCADSRKILTMLADPRPIGPGCKVAPALADAEALARSIRSDPDLEATAPVPVTIGGIPALQIDVVTAPGATACPWQLPGLSSTTPLLLKNAPLGGGEWARLYLLDPPGGSARVFAIAIISSEEEDYAAALEAAAPFVDSMEFHARPQGQRGEAS